VTMEGHIAVAVKDERDGVKVIVLKRLIKFVSTA